MQYKSQFLNEAVARGFIYQSTNLESLDEYLQTPGRGGYVGFDITASSLHVGHLLPIFTMRLFQKCGHKPFIIVGGGTTKIGDPSFRNKTRPMLSEEQINENLKGIKECLLPFLKFGDNENDAVMLNNNDWLANLNYLDFLRDVGTYFSINRMIGFDSVKTKLSENNSLSFLEFNYMILQGFDFYTLFKNYDCRLQLGGQDQWGNIVNGVELIHKKLNAEAFALTNPLLTTSDGKKMGKTSNGAVWLSEKLLSSYDFWQYWRNVQDADVIKLMYLFTDIPVEEIKRMEKIQGAELNDLKVILADAVTSIVRGPESLKGIHQMTDAMFKGSGNDLSNLDSAQKFIVKKSDENSGIIDVLVNSGLCSSRGDAKRLVRGNGVCVNDVPVDEFYKFSENFNNGELIKLSCGKKKNIVILMAE